MPRPFPRHVLITGASRGLGAALARAYAQEGVRLSLTARTLSPTHPVVAACQHAGADVEAAALDVLDIAGLQHWMRACDRHRPVDLVIANAAVSATTLTNKKNSATTLTNKKNSATTLTNKENSATTLTNKENSATTLRTKEGSATTLAGALAPDAQIIATNLTAALATAQSLAPAMAARGKGQLALVGSLAGRLALPDAVAYCAAKAGLATATRALRAQMRPQGVAVSLILPGFVDTDMTAALPRRPGLLAADEAAALIRRRLTHHPATLTVPRWMGPLTRLAGLVPPGWLS